jgi:acyl-CoA thioester hydrolase
MGGSAVTVVRHDSPLGRWEMASRDAHPRVRGHVGGYIGYLEVTPRPLRRREVPSADITLIISLGPAIEVFDAAHRGGRFTSFVAGVWDAPALTEHAGYQHGIEVNLTPLGARRLLGLPMHHLANGVVPSRGLRACDDRVVPFVHRLRVRFHECDPQGVVFNAHYFAYFDIALTEMWRAAFGSYGNVVQDGTDVVVVEAAATFRAPARFDEEIDVELAIARLGTTSMTTQTAVRRDGELLVEGRIVHVFVDPATMAKQEIPDRVRAGLEPYTVA